MSLVRINDDNLAQFMADIEAIEGDSEYPLGNDFFRISHGRDYFSFFRRLGRVFYYGWLENGHAIAVAAAVLRSLKIDSKAINAWYLCDLKVHPLHRGKRIPLKLFSRGLILNYLRCPRFYAVVMNPAGQTSNRTVRILQKFRWLDIQCAGQLLIWSLTYEQITAAAPTIQKYRCRMGFSSLSGIKDIILKSTGKPMPLLHANFLEQTDAQFSEPQPGFVHMLCANANDPLARELETECYLKASASATIISHRMPLNDWSWIETCDI